MSAAFILDSDSSLNDAIRTLRCLPVFFFCFFLLSLCFYLPHFQAETEILQHVRSEPLGRSHNCADFVTRLAAFAPPGNSADSEPKDGKFAAALSAAPSAFA